jgi:hypothetical protein
MGERRGEEHRPAEEERGQLGAELKTSSTRSWARAVKSLASCSEQRKGAAESSAGKRTSAGPWRRERGKEKQGMGARHGEEAARDGEEVPCPGAENDSTQGCSKQREMSRGRSKQGGSALEKGAVARSKE